ncbi:hypothetical protein LX36DRAFT_673372 [Colletotrichum falcatum]|nr:hypothetical protein LX36DRAFT_673372 [Colletotrichum falcatum]
MPLWCSVALVLLAAIIGNLDSANPSKKDEDWTFVAETLANNHGPGVAWTRFRVSVQWRAKCNTRSSKVEFGFSQPRLDALLCHGGTLGEDARLKMGGTRHRVYRVVAPKLRSGQEIMGGVFVEIPSISGSRF